MRRKISLYIADQLVDLDEGSFILFNYTMEELSNPTIVRNSFSKQITLKGTANNNKIFAQAFRLDRKTEYGDSYQGIYFDVNRKTPFAIYNEMNEIVESGYVKLDEVSKGKSIEYKITLYGGLGSFFYALSYNEDGSTRSLASLKYRKIGGLLTSQPGQVFPFSPLSVINQCWEYLYSPQDYVERIDYYDINWCNIINFAPCYNGLPSDFSADKIVCNQPYENVPRAILKVEYPEGGPTDYVSYSFKNGTDSNLMVLTNPHTEWELRELRWYLQRPVISVKAIIEAICLPENNGGWEVELSPLFFNPDNPLYQQAWITLPLIPTKERYDENPIYKSLKETKSPMDYLLSYTKAFGLVYLQDPYKKKISILSRQEFYSKESVLIDLTERVNVDSIKIIPTLADKHFYQYGGESKGVWAEEYKKEQGRDYGIQRVNTGNEFNMETGVLTTDILYNDAVEVHERNLLFFSNELARDEGGGIVESFVLPRYESVKLQLWGTSYGEEEQHMEEFDVTTPYEWLRFPFNVDYPLSDFLPKVQFHDAENKAVDGANVLLLFNGVYETPTWRVFGKNTQMTYRLTDDTPDMMTLNENVPCWNYSPINSTELTRLPSFRRCVTHKENGKEIIDATFEWGEPLVRGTQGVEHKVNNPATIYNEYWKIYQSDRFNTDTMRITCKVNLSGLRVDKDLMRRFFYYDGAIFCLNKITNHSLTTFDDTECELIKVQDINNYTE